MLCVSINRNMRANMSAQEELIKVFASIDDNADMSSFFREIFTSKEMNDLSMRWQLLKELYEGQPQRTIAAKYKIQGHGNGIRA